MKIIRSPAKYANFVERYADNAIKYFFVLYLCPLNREFISIPICLIPKTNGNATQSITYIFDSIIISLKNIGINFIGEVFDGDPGWLSRIFTFAQDIYDLILENLSLTQEELAKHASLINKGLLIYEDLYFTWINATVTEKQAVLLYVQHYTRPDLLYQLHLLKKMEYLNG